MTYAEWGAFLIGSIGVAGFFWLIRSDKLPAGLRILASLCVIGAMAVGTWLLTVHSGGLRPVKGKGSATIFSLVATEPEIKRLREEEAEMEGVAEVTWGRA
jgi:hypothetical protein